jgi:PBP1b-binding outer membrane lipoprotein LpoB
MNTNKRSSLISILLFSMIWLSCSNQGSPGDVAVQFIEYLQEKDWENAKKLATEDSKPMINMIQLMGEGGMEGLFEKQDMEVDNVEQKGNKAEVMLSFENGDKRKIALRKENSEWKVVFSKTGLMDDMMDMDIFDGLDSLDLDLDFTKPEIDSL